LHYFADVAVEAATLAGTQLLGNFRRHHASIYGADVFSVSNRSLSKEVTSSNDHEADKIIIDLITSRCPDHDILTEETGHIDNGSPYKWIIDPLDGSSNFLNHNPFFAVSIALAYEDVPITGVVFAPYIEEMAVARKDQGCTINGRPVAVSTTTELAKTYIVGCPGGDPNNQRFAKMEYTLHQKNKDFRKIGSAAVEAYMVAAGRVDAFTTLNISPWDVAAGVLCVEEAGGKVTDFNGDPWNLQKTDMLVSNGHVHDAVLAEIQGAGIPGANPSIVSA
jgi:myo-inositol-1(or 4)-monophosphatase